MPSNSSGIFCKVLLFLAATSFFSFITAAGPEPVRVIPVNVAEAVFAPFWEYEISELKNWQIAEGKNYGEVKQNWCYVTFSWNKSNPEGPVIKISRKGPIDCKEYDNLLTSINLPAKSKFKITLSSKTTGVISQEWTVEKTCKEEYEMPLQGAAVIDEISLEIYSNKKEEPQSGWISWMGFRNSKQLEAYKSQWKKLAEQPLDIFLAPQNTEPSYAPKFNLIGTASEIEAVRKKCQDVKEKTGETPFSVKPDFSPEKVINEFLAFGANPKIFGRVADYDQASPEIARLAEAGIVKKDKELLRLAAKGAIAMAMCPNWDAGFTIFFPGSAFEQRPFAQAVIIYNIAITLDLAWDMFSPAGRSLLLRKIATDGIGLINFNVWKHSYIFNCNQLAVFSHGRIASYLVLEKQYGHVTPYTDLAYKELCESLNKIIQPDGGFLEGSGYMQYTISAVANSLNAYSSARGLPIKSIMPEKLEKLANYGDAFISTDKRGGLVPYSSGQGECRGVTLDAQAFLAYICPESQWVTLFRNTLGKMKSKMPGSSLAVWIMENKIPQQAPAFKPFINMPDMCVLSSTRVFENEKVKILLFGTPKSFAGHQHEDRGSFVLEFAGDTFAMDPGGQNYSEAGAEEMKHSQKHNMLLPTGTEERPHAVIPSPADIRPSGQGDEKSFSAEINPGFAWEKYYKKWTRSINSETPDKFIITDEYELTGGTGVDFLWMTQLPVTVNGNTIKLEGEKSYAFIKTPSDTTIKIEELPLRTKETMKRIKIHKDGTKGKLVISIELSIKSMK